MKLLRTLLLILLAVLLLAPTAALYAIASTQAGLRLVAAHLGRIGPVKITIEQVSGTLIDGFTVASLRVQERHADVRITDAAGRLRLLPLLLQRRIELSGARARQVSVQVFHVAAAQSSGRLRFMPPTFGVEVDAARADNVDLVLISGRRLHATSAAAGIQVLSGVIHIRDGQLDWQETHMAVTGDVRAADPVGLDGRISADWHPQGKPAWQFTASFDGDLDRLPLKLDIAKPFHAHAEGAATALEGNWKFAGKGATRDLDISVFGGGDALGLVSAEGTVAVNASGFAFNGPVTAPGLKIGAVQVDFHGAYAGRRLTIGESTLLHRPSGSSATVRGTVDVLPDGPRLALAGKWSALRWPLGAEQPAFTSPQGQYSIEGRRPWQVQAEGEFAAAGVAGIPASLRGVLDADTFTLGQATLGLFGGTATLAGEAHWHPEESWSITGHVKGLDTAQLRADLPGRVDFDFRAGGAPFGAAGDIRFAVAHLAGKLRGQPATGGGQFSKPAGSADWHFQQVDLQVGQARLQLDGSLGAPRDIRFAVDADDLSLLQAGMHGRISARGRFAGTDEAPLLLFKARGTAFQWQDYQVDALDADVDVDLGANGHAQGKLDLAGIHRGERTVQQAVLNLAGSGERQHVELDIGASPLRAALVAEGAMQDGAWHGAIQNLTINDDADLALHLQAPAPLVLDLQHAQLGDLCLTGGRAHGCVSGRRDPDGRWTAAFSAEDMPLHAFTAGLSQEMDYEGTIGLHGELAGAPQSLPTGSVTAALTKAQLRHGLGNGVETFALGSGSVQAAATETGFSAQVALDAGAFGSVNGQLTGQRSADAWQDYPIHGQLDSRTDALSLLDIYVGDIDKATGQLTTHADIGGTLGNPALTGQLQLRNASIDVYQLGSSLRDLSLDARFDTRTLDLTGQARLGDCTARAGECTAHFSGQLSWRDGEPYGNLHMEGDHLRLVDVPEARIDASPRLDFKLSGHRIEASGEVVIPRADLEPADLTNTVLTSSDEVLVGAPPVDPNQRWTVISGIKLTLGDDVHLNALGLDAKLGGSLTVRTDEAQNSRGQGDLDIKSGKYRKLARVLDIESGRLIFRGPLNDPGVELKAQKEFPDVTAGVYVRGTLRAPQMTFFSDPEMPQSQIASLILAGGSLDAQGTDKTGAPRNDLAVVGAAQAGALLAQSVGNRVGIQDVGLESYTDAEGHADTSLVLGRYLTPRVYVSYGISLVEAINTFKMRLTLGKGWTVKTEAGQARSADIVYTFKKGKKDKAAEQKEAAPAAAPAPTPTPTPTP